MGFAKKDAGRTMTVLGGALFGLLAGGTNAADDVEAAKQAYAAENFGEAISLLQEEIREEGAAGRVAREIVAASHQRRGELHFQNGRIAECIEDFDQVIALFPAQAPQHWQRGIALYYAERYADGVAQFELHRTVNPEDVENAVWHFLCAVRAPGGSVASARENLIPVSRDRRIPMKEINQMFAGTTTPEEVLAAGEIGGQSGQFYADLYVGLYYEALGKDEEAMTYLAKAAVNPSAHHYMGDVARTHLLVRGRNKADN